MNLKPNYEEIKIVTLGNVSSGKSSIIGVLTQNILDDGRGKARFKICKYPHEQECGKTSAIGHHYIIYKNTDNDVYKTITLIDLAGHEKYLKTTLNGINSSLCDYVLLIIGSNMGVSRMTREHFAIAKSLNKPIIIIVTKIDICPPEILNHTMEQIDKILASNFAGNKKPWIIENSENTLKVAKIISKNYSIYPIFKVSNVTGENINYLKEFLENINNLPLNSVSNDTVFIIDDIFHINGIGIVISGTVQNGTISVSEKLWLGPFDGKYKEIIVKSIHGNIRNSINSVSEGYSCCLAIKVNNKKDIIKKKNIKKNMVVISNPYSVYDFTAKIYILHHATTIKINYQLIIHCNNIRQAAKIVEIDKEITRSGDIANVKFRFLFHPEYIIPNSKIIFREGRTKGVGEVTKIFK